MAQYYKLQNPGVSGISIDGIEHRVDPETGIMTIEMMTPNLAAEMNARGAISVDGPGAEAKATPPKPEQPPRGERPGHATTPGVPAPPAASTKKSNT